MSLHTMQECRTLKHAQLMGRHAPALAHEHSALASHARTLAVLSLAALLMWLTIQMASASFRYFLTTPSRARLSSRTPAPARAQRSHYAQAHMVWRDNLPAADGFVEQPTVHMRLNPCH